MIPSFPIDKPSNSTDNPIAINTNFTDISKAENINKKKKGLFKDQTGISSILHLHGDFNIPTDDVVKKGKMLRKRDTTSLERIIEEKPKIIEPLNF
jgi:hypothetical protein